MNSPNRSEFEIKAVRTANRVCDNFRDQFSALDLEIPAPAVTRHDPAGGLTELELPVRRGSLYVAYIEFFIWRNGRPSMGLEEIQAFLEDELEAIFADQQATLRHKLESKGLISRLFSFFSGNREDNG